jgi:hypothetical protein
MSANRFDLWQLAARIRNGDDRASGEFLSELQRQLSRMIRRHVRLGQMPSDVGQWVAVVMGQRLDDIGSATPTERDSFIEEAAQRICCATLQAVRMASPATETVRVR